MADQILGCPLGVIAGEPIIAKVLCPEGYDLQVVVSGLLTDFEITPGPCIFIPTQTVTGQEEAGNALVEYGFVDIEVTCVPPPGSGLAPIIETCSTEVIDPNEYLDCETCAPVCVDVILCNIRCYCAEATISVIDCEPQCETAKIGGFGVNSIASDPPPPEEPCVPVEPIALAGTKPAWLPEVIEEEFLPEYCEEEGLFCLPHQPILIWNSVCGCPGWTVSGAGIEGTDASFACGCVGGTPWKFFGSGTMTASGPPTGVDIAVIWQHNMISGSVTTSPAAFGGPVDTNLCYDEACIDGFTRPIVIPLDGITTTGSVSATISGATADGGPIEIGYIMFGQKLFLPEEALRVGFQNPHNSCDTEIETKRNECGDIMQVRTKRKTVPLSLNLNCAKEEFTKRYWRSYLRYLAAGNPVLFQWSINRCPTDLFYGFKTNASGSYSSAMYQDLILNAEGYVNQRQPKAFA